MHPKVSVQIPTYNQAAFIKRTIESCLMQDYPNLEVNIADDCSTDGTRDIVGQFLSDKSVRYFCNEKNIGRVANYHKALYEYATGEWAINLDGDDYFKDRSFITRAIEQIKAVNEEALFVYQANNNINKVMLVLPESKKINENSILVDGAAYFLKYHKILNFHHCSTLYKRSEAVKLNFYTFNCLFTDFNSVAKLFVLGKVIISGSDAAHWSQHDKNESAALHGGNLKNEFAAIQELADFALIRFSKLAMKKWEWRMNAFFLGIYYDMQVTVAQKRKAVKYIVRYFNFSEMYLRLLLKSFLRLSAKK